MEITGVSSLNSVVKQMDVSTPAEAQSKFSTFLKDSINKVNDAQIESDKVTEKMIMGENVDLHTVMITSQKASILLDTTIQVRNKAVEAYQEIMRMQV